MRIISSNIISLIEEKYKNILILIINVALLLAFIFIPDIQLIMCFGGWLFFLVSVIFSKKLSTISLISLFLLLSIPFLIIGFIIISLKFYGEISIEGILSTYPVFSLFLLSFSIGFIIGVLIQKLIKNSITKVSLIVSLSCMVFAFLSGSQGWPFQFVFTGLIFFIAGFFNRTKSLKQLIIFYFILVMPFSLVFSSYVLLNSLSHIYPIVLIPFVSSIIGIICDRYIQRSFLIFGFILGIIYLSVLGMGYWGMKNYLGYIWSLEKNPIINEIKFDVYNSSDTSFTENNIRGKTTVLYFHTTSCSVCYKKLPELETLYLDYKDDTNTLILAVHIPLSIIEDTSIIMRHHRKFKYSFPQYFAKGGKDIYEKRFNIVTYPHVSIIGKNGNTIHNGRFNNDPTVFVNNARTLVLSDK